MVAFNSMMKVYTLFLGILAVWRVTHLLQAEDGPFDVIVRMRRTVGNGFWGSLFDCFYCLSLWIAAPIAILIGASTPERLLLWPALSGAAILLERMTAPPRQVDAYWKEEEFNELLRKEEN